MAKSILDLPVEIQHQVLRYVIPNREYFVIRYPRQIAFRNTGVQKLLHDSPWGVSDPPTTVSQSTRTAEETAPRRSRRIADFDKREMADAGLKSSDRKLVILTGPKTLLPKQWLPFFFVCKAFKEACYKVFYGENRFIFHVGSQALCAEDTCIPAQPFNNPLARFIETGLVSYMSKIHLMIRICLPAEDVDVQGEEHVLDGNSVVKAGIGIVSRWDLSDGRVSSYAIRKRCPQELLLTRFKRNRVYLKLWISHLVQALSKRDAPMHEVGVRVRHYRPAGLDFIYKYLSDVPPGLASNIELEEWREKHQTWSDFNAMVKGQGLSLPGVFDQLAKLSRVNRATISGIEGEEAQELVRLMMSESDEVISVPIDRGHTVTKAIGKQRAAHKGKRRLSEASVFGSVQQGGSKRHGTRQITKLES